MGKGKLGMLLNVWELIMYGQYIWSRCWSWSWTRTYARSCEKSSLTSPARLHVGMH
jgi:hypothetical protein